MIEQYTINLVIKDTPWLHIILPEISEEDVTFKHNLNYIRYQGRVIFEYNHLIFKNKADLITFKLKYL